MAQTNVNIRMDEELKEQFSQFCNEVGMTMTTAICIFAKAVVRQQKIPFEINADPFYSQENIAELERRVANINSGVSKFTEHELIEVDDE